MVNWMDLGNVGYKNDDNQRFLYVNGRHFVVLLITQFTFARSAIYGGADDVLTST